MLRAKVENIIGSLRYKVVTVSDDEFYLMDIQPSIILIIFPFLHPLFYKRCYKIDVTSYNKLKMDAAVSPISGLRIGELVGLSLIASMIFRIFPIIYLGVDELLINYIILCFIICLGAYFRWKYSKTSIDVKNIINHQPVEYFKLYYNDIRIFIIYLLIFIFSSFIYMILKEIFISPDRSIVLYFILFFLYFGYLFTSLMFYSVGNYTIKK
ncbi:DUF443 family protein [Streptococcus suis]|nr:DUF443 family protein [Streptococcus suis]